MFQFSLMLLGYNFSRTGKECNKHCIKSVRIRSNSGPHFPAFGLNTESTEYLSVFSLNAGKCGPE